MHYRGFVFVDEPTEEAVEVAMKRYGWGDKYDWYQCGGRYDGYLLGDAEMAARGTCGGFNADLSNASAARNSCKVRDIPTDRQSVHFFVANRRWVEDSFYVDGYPSGRWFDNELFRTQLELAITENPDKWAVVVDAHN